MLNKKFVLLPLLIIVVIGGAYWFYDSLSMKVEEESAQIDGSENQMEEQTKESGSKNEQTTSPAAPVESSTGIDADLNAIDTLSADSYDDSSLDAEFSSQSSNSLTDPYAY